MEDLNNALQLRIAQQERRQKSSDSEHDTDRC